MSTTTIAWVLLAIAQIGLSVRRPVWALGFYMQTYFAAPQLWWWGDQLPELRFAMWAGLILLVTAVAHGARPPATSERSVVSTAAIAMVVNATFVHFLLAPQPDVSVSNYVELSKYVLLFFLMKAAIRTRDDFRAALVTIAVGAAYIGWEITINGRGNFSGSRLEGVGAPGAETANGLAQLMLISLPLVGSLILNRTWLAKLVATGASPLVLNVLLVCNSRGAFLGLIGAATSFLLVSKGPARKRAFVTLALGGASLFLLLGDPKILDRFATTFVGSEERDNSAASRLDFWRAGMMLLADHPLGAGGNAFKIVYGSRYLGEATNTQDPDSRSLHNGYLTEATDWGVQGLVLKLLFIGGALLAAYRTTERARLEGRVEDSLVGISVFVAGAGGMIHCIFGSFLANEYMYWLAAILVRYAEIYRADPGAQATVEEQRAA